MRVTGTYTPAETRSAATPDVTVSRRARLTRGPSSAYRATALAAATFSESTPCSIGITTVVSAWRSAWRLRPSPSVPSTSAIRSGGSAAKASSVTASSSRASAARWKPASCSSGAASDHSGSRVHGTCSTVPMLTRTLRR